MVEERDFYGAHGKNRIKKLVFLALFPLFSRVESSTTIRTEYLLPTHSLDFFRFNDSSTLRTRDIERRENFLSVDLL